MAELDALARVSDAEPPAVTRVLYTDADLAARALIKDLCAEAGLVVREDPIGNTFARWEGLAPDLPAVGTGSHIDAIPHSGRFDGTVGVLGGLEAIRALRRGGFQPGAVDRAIDVHQRGADAVRHRLPGQPGALRGVDARADGRAAGRGRPRPRRDPPRRRVRWRAARMSGSPEGYYSAFVELHIEQGPILEREGLPIGIVTAIAAPAAMRVTWEGEGGHAGAVLMPGRSDALCAAAEAVLAVEAAAWSVGGPDSVATTGVCRVHPGAINSIPDRVTLEIDIRDIDLAHARPRRRRGPARDRRDRRAARGPAPWSSRSTPTRPPRWP